MDVASCSLARARRYLHLDDMPPAQRERIEVVQGSLLYRDKRLEGFDVAALVEVVEHLDPPRLDAMERVVFAHARPRRVIVTTPNREYNVHWEALRRGETAPSRPPLRVDARRMPGVGRARRRKHMATASSGARSAQRTSRLARPRRW